MDDSSFDRLALVDTWRQTVAEHTYPTRCQPELQSTSNSRNKLTNPFGSPAKNLFLHGKCETGNKFVEQREVNFTKADKHGSHLHAMDGTFIIPSEPALVKRSTLIAPFVYGYTSLKLFITKWMPARKVIIA
jgi:hypothetical protein